MDDCAICGELAERTWDRGPECAYWCPNEPREVRVCLDCWRRIDQEPIPLTYDEALWRVTEKETR